MRTNTEQRQEEIMDQVLNAGRVEVKDVASKLAISEATARRDLRSLSRQKRVDLVYGGATLPRNRDFSFQSRSVRAIKAKRKIGRLAAGLIHEGDQVFLDSGTTCFQMVPHLKMKKNVSVMANSLKVTSELGGVSGLQLIQIGGTYRADRSDTVGPLALNVVEQLRGYKAFVGADGLSPDFGVSACDLDSAHLYRHVIHNAQETILLVDHTKLQAPSLYKITEFDLISRVVTNEQPRGQWRDFFEEKGIELIFPEQE
jgi:DeoR family fructose operon transcriptional repressor